MKRPVITMLKKGSKIKNGDLIIVADCTLVEACQSIGKIVHGPNSAELTEGFYFRITWKEDIKCTKR